MTDFPRHLDDSPAVEKPSACPVLAQGLAFPEGPAFDSFGGLWGVELKGGCIFSAGTGEEPGEVRRWGVGGAPNGLAIAEGRLWFCDAEAGAIRSFKPTRGAPDVRTEIAGARLDRPNDLAFDPTGSLVFTCPGQSRRTPTGTIWRRAPDGGLSLVAEGLYFPNGLAFSPDGKEFVVAETYRHRLWRGGWDAQTGRWIDPRPWAPVKGPIGPDGMAFDTTGRLFVAVFGQGEVVQLSPEGATTGRHALAGGKPTNVAFDPVWDRGLVVTEAERGQLISLPAIAGKPALFPEDRSL